MLKKKNEKQVKKSNEMSEIYQKYLKASKNPDLKYLNKSLKDYSYDKSEIDAGLYCKDYKKQLNYHYFDFIVKSFFFTCFS